MAKSIKKYLYFTVLLLLFIPELQRLSKIIPEMPLKGAITEPNTEELSLDSWFGGYYQTIQEKYINDKFGFRNTCVRIHNQIAYSLFNKAHAANVVIGKEDYLYEIGYIHDYIGYNFIGESAVTEKLRMAKFIQEQLKKRNKNLILIFAAGKASFFPEYIPDEYIKIKREPSNYTCFSRLSREFGLDMIDFNKYFCENKNKTPYPLYPKTGIHWSYYSMFKVADSISHFIGVLRNIKTPRIDISKFELSEKLQNTDQDIEDGMNLLFSIPKYKMAYPKQVYNDSCCVKPRVLTIGDSYYWGIYGSEMVNKIFDKPYFWYYHRELFGPEIIGNLPNYKVDLKNLIDKNDVIMILFTEATIYTFGFGFIEELYALLTKENPDNELKNKIDFYINKMKNNPDWLELIKKKAKEQKLPIDTVMRNDAIYMVKTNP